MKVVTVSSKNQIVIPSIVRSKLGIVSEDKLIIAKITNTEVVIKKESGYSDLIGTLPTQKKDPVNRIREIREIWNAYYYNLN